MLFMLAKAAGIITISIGALYYGMAACVNYAHDALDQGEPVPAHPQVQQYMPEKLGNDPEHPVARLLEIDQCHTENWVPNTPDITFQVQRIIDGDTILAHTSEQPHQRLRLWGIDAPESDQPHGAQATARLHALVPTGKMTKARNMGTDKYDRILVVIGEDNELPVNWTMVMTGNAHHMDRVLELLQRHQVQSVIDVRTILASRYCRSSTATTSTGHYATTKSTTSS